MPHTTKDNGVEMTPGEKRLDLITAMGRFRPKTATPIQFYNYVREFCIMHNCSIDEAMERTQDIWSKLGQQQKELYNSKAHAALPIPVPRHLIYRALKMERAGRWKICSKPATNGSQTIYTVESFSPPVKPSKLKKRLLAQRPRYDNLAETPPPYHIQVASRSKNNRISTRHEHQTKCSTGNVSFKRTQNGQQKVPPLDTKKKPTVAPTVNKKLNANGRALQQQQKKKQPQQQPQPPQRSAPQTKFKQKPSNTKHNTKSDCKSSSKIHKTAHHTRQTSQPKTILNTVRLKL